MKILGKLADKLKIKDASKALVDVLESGVKKIELNERQEPSGFFRVSDIGYCLRNIYYRRIVEKEFGANLLFLFEAGKDAGKRVVKYTQAENKLFGQFVCAVCGKFYSNCAMYDKCPACGASRMKYCETGIRYFNRKIGGRIDLFFNYDKPVLVEVKSASTHYKLGDKKKIEEQLGHNIHQGNTYLGLLRSYLRSVEKKDGKKFLFYEADYGHTFDGLVLCERLEKDYFLLLYEDRNACRYYSHKMYYDHNMYLEDLKSIKSFFEYWDNKELPPKDVERKRCKYCDFAQKCGGDRCKKRL